MIETEETPRTTRAAKLLVRSLAEVVLGVALGALVLWVLVVSVSDIEFVYQGF